MTMTPEIAVVVCTYNGASGVMATLDSLNRQTIRDRMEIIVVDDGSVPEIEECEVAGLGAELIRHQSNLGLGAARNTGIAGSRAPIIAFTDDDCRPTPDWAGSLVQAYAECTVGAVGGPIVGSARAGLLARYYRWNQPIRPLEADLGRSASLPYRAWLYARQNIAPADHSGERDVYSLVGANFSFRREVLEAVGGFDAGIRFGGEDEDVCDRIRQTLPGRSLRVVPGAVVEHDYDPRLRDALRRARAYGMGSARNFTRHEHVAPTFYPLPVLWALALVVGLGSRRRHLGALLLPLLFAPRWMVTAVRCRSVEPLSYAYIQALQEGASNIGFVRGLWAGRSTTVGGGNS